MPIQNIVNFSDSMIADKPKKQEIELKKTKNILDEEDKQARELEQRHKEQQEELNAMGQRFGTLQEELEYINKRLSKVWKKFQDVQQEVETMQDDFHRERQDMYDTITELDNQLKLKNVSGSR